MDKLPNETTKMDAIREFGDPDDLIYKEDLVLLKYEDPWPATRPLPVGCAIVEGSSRRLLSTTTTKLVCSRKELENTGITGALFAGCVAFESNSSLSTAAADILARSHTLVLIHNRDMISQLIFCFPGIRLLVLHHDLRMHSEMEWPESHGRDPRIRKIMGDSPGGGADYLYICAEGLSNLATLCPQLLEVQAPIDDIIRHVPKSSDFSEFLRQTKNFIRSARKLILGLYLKRPDQGYVVWDGVDSLSITNLIRINPKLECLEVNTDCVEAFLAVKGFSNLRQLSLRFLRNQPPTELPNFGTSVLVLLKKFSLEALSLVNFDKVRVSSIAQHCASTLSSLALIDCNVVSEDVPRDCFQKLEHLSISKEVTSSTFRSILASCPNLSTLELKCRDTSVMFLKDFFPSGCLQKLERLTLCTDESFLKLGIDVHTMRTLLKRFPSLRYVATDSYSMRVFFEHEAPHIKLHWTDCTVCAAELSKIYPNIFDVL